MNLSDIKVARWSGANMPVPAVMLNGIPVPLSPYELESALAEALAIIAKLPKDADRITKLPGDIVWRVESGGVVSERNVQWRPEYDEGSPCYWAYWGVYGPPVPVEECHSTRKAAEAEKVQQTPEKTE